MEKMLSENVLVLVIVWDAGLNNVDASRVLSTFFYNFKWVFIEFFFSIIAGFDPSGLMFLLLDFFQLKLSFFYEYWLGTCFLETE